MTLLAHDWGDEWFAEADNQCGHRIAASLWREYTTLKERLHVIEGEMRASPWEDHREPMDDESLRMLAGLIPAVTPMRNKVPRG